MCIEFMKDALILQDKKYISAKRAAIIFGYSSDYVGQLCREGKIECTMVGRSWFVSEESVLNHKLSNSESEVSTEVTPKLVEQSAPVIPVVPVVPEVSKPAFLKPESKIEDFIAHVSKPIVVSTPAPIATPLAAPIASTTSVQQVKVAEPIAKVPVISPIQVSHIKKSDKKHSKLDLSLVLLLLLLSAIFLGRSFISYFPFSSRDIVATAMNGIVVAPSLSSDSENESLKNDLRNPFSDEVQIKPDSSGTSGVIVPVFKESKGDDFLYVMVPVKDTKKDENK